MLFSLGKATRDIIDNRAVYCKRSDENGWKHFGYVDAQIGFDMGVQSKTLGKNLEKPEK